MAATWVSENVQSNTSSGSDKTLTFAATAFTAGDIVTIDAIANNGGATGTFATLLTPTGGTGVTWTLVRPVQNGDSTSGSSTGAWWALIPSDQTATFAQTTNRHQVGDALSTRGVMTRWQTVDTVNPIRQSVGYGSSATDPLITNTDLQLTGMKAGDAVRVSGGDWSAQTTVTTQLDSGLSRTESINANEAGQMHFISYWQSSTLAADDADVRAEMDASAATGNWSAVMYALAGAASAAPGGPAPFMFGPLPWQEWPLQPYGVHVPTTPLLPPPAATQTVALRHVVRYPPHNARHVPPPQFNPPLPLPLARQPRQMRGFTLRLGRSTSPTPPQLNPPLPLRPLARHLVPAFVRRGRAVTPVPGATVVVVNPPPSSTGQHRVWLGALRRGRPAVPPLADQPFPLTRRRPVSRPLALRRGRPAVPPLSDQPFPLTRRRPVSRLANSRRGGAPTPVPPQLNPPLPLRLIRRTVVPGWLRRGARLWPTQAQQPAAPNPRYATAGDQHRILAGWTRRGRAVIPVPPQLNPPLPLTPLAAHRWPRWLRRGSAPSPVPVQAPPTNPTLPSRASQRRLVATLTRRGRAPAPVPAQPMPLRSAQERRLQPTLLRRGRAPTPVPPQSNPPLPLRPVQERRLVPTLLRRGRGATPVPRQANPPIVLRPSARRRLAGWLLRAAKYATPPWFAPPPPASPPLTPPLLTSAVISGRTSTTAVIDGSATTSGTVTGRGATTGTVDGTMSTTAVISGRGSKQ